MSLQVRDLPIK